MYTVFLTNYVTIINRVTIITYTSWWVYECDKIESFLISQSFSWLLSKFISNIIIKIRMSHIKTKDYSFIFWPTVTMNRRIESDCYETFLNDEYHEEETKTAM